MPTRRRRSAAPTATPATAALPPSPAATRSPLRRRTSPRPAATTAPLTTASHGRRTPPPASARTSNSIASSRMPRGAAGRRSAAGRTRHGLARRQDRAARRRHDALRLRRRACGRGADLVPPQRPLPRMRGRGQAQATMRSARARKPRASCDLPTRLACQALVERDDIDVGLRAAPPPPRASWCAPMRMRRAGPRPSIPSSRARATRCSTTALWWTGYRGHMLGLAVDLGTTTVVLDFVDLEIRKERPQRRLREPAGLRRQRRDAPHLLRPGRQGRRAAEGRSLRHQPRHRGRLRAARARPRVDLRDRGRGQSHHARHPVQARRAGHRPEALQVIHRACLSRGRAPPTRH